MRHSLPAEIGPLIKFRSPVAVTSYAHVQLLGAFSKPAHCWIEQVGQTFSQSCGLRSTYFNMTSISAGHRYSNAPLTNCTPQKTKINYKRQRFDSTRIWADCTISIGSYTFQLHGLQLHMCASIPNFIICVPPEIICWTN